MSPVKPSTKGRKDLLRAQSRKRAIKHLSYQPIAKKVDVAAIKASFVSDQLKSDSSPKATIASKSEGAAPKKKAAASSVKAQVAKPKGTLSAKANEVKPTRTKKASAQSSAKVAKGTRTGTKK